MILVYIICILCSIALCFWYYSVDIRRSVVQNIMVITVLVANLGFLSLSVSPDLDSAILSTKILYIGACFLPALFFFTVCEVCKVKLKKWLISSLVLMQGIIYGMVCTIGYSDLYYKTVEYRNVDKMVSLVKTYGVCHFLFPASLICYVIASFAVSLYALRVKKNVQSRTITVMLLALGVSATYYIVQTVLRPKADITPIVYIIFMTGALIPIYKSDIFDVTENDEVIFEQLNSIGFLTFDEKMNFMGANIYAQNLDESFKNTQIGTKIKNPPVELTNTIREIALFLEERNQIKSHCCVEGSNVKIKGKTYKCEIHSLINPLKRCVGATLVLHDITEHINIIEMREQYNDRLEKEVSRKTERIRNIQEKTIFGMAQMVESRDWSTGGHIKRTSEVVKIFSNKLMKSDLGLDQKFLNLVIRSAPMHDLGKIGVDDAILRKNGKFTDEEYEKMKKHSEIGGQMILGILGGVEEPDFVSVAFNVANYHHEKVNGKGYPAGLSGNEIPIEARIMALADVFDALVSKRCYKEAFSYDDAFAIIEKDAGSHFDEKLAAIFMTCRPELEAYYDMES